MLCTCVCVSALMPNQAKKLCDGEERLQRITKGLSALRRLRGNTTLKAFLLPVAPRQRSSVSFSSLLIRAPLLSFFSLALRVHSLQWQGRVSI